MLLKGEQADFCTSEVQKYGEVRSTGVRLSPVDANTGVQDYHCLAGMQKKTKFLTIGEGYSSRSSSSSLVTAMQLYLMNVYVI